MPGGTRTSAARASGKQRITASKPHGRPPATPAVATSGKMGNNAHIPIDLTGEGPSAPSRKRKADIAWPSASQSMENSPPSKASKPSSSASPQSKKKKGGGEEKRLRRFRSQEPKSFGEIFDRAMSQRFFVLERRRTGTDECPGEVVELTGSTGNVYTVSIGRQPECNCPHARKGNQCKHIIFVSFFFWFLFQFCPLSHNICTHMSLRS